jgi:uncharacterized membrane protein
MSVSKQVKTMESLRVGWQALGQNLWMLLGLAAIYAVAIAVGELGGGLIKILSNLAQWVLMGVLMLAGIHVIRQGGSKAGGIGDLPLEGPRMLNFLLVNLVCALIIFGGLLLLIVPGIIWGLKYGFASAFALEEGCGVGESLERSAQLTDGIKWDLFMQNLVYVGVVILGLLALLVGVIPASLCVVLAWSWTYVDLRAQVEGA